MEDSDYSSVSNTNAIIFNGASDFSVRTESLISGPNIPNSSSTSEDEYQQQISTAAGGRGTDDSMTISSCGSSSWFKNNNDKQSDQQEIRIFNVDFRALSQVGACSTSNKGLESNNRLNSCLSPDIETRIRLVNNLMACAKAVQQKDLSLAEEHIRDIKILAISQTGAMKEVDKAAI
ncbi:DELLA protein GAI-like [Lycium ferocissimum]|uniref:DELLA protein GAI-like n=1 Tax=Lycium ferocissimum TaxID=112874 RepID=UPI0028153E11|nr:DELLA protein GAI-like [Lycium ferocissimum]